MGPSSSSRARLDVAVLTRDLGIEPTYVYDGIVDGFAADAPRRLERLPGAIVSPDRPVQAFVQNMPTGVGRVDADRDPIAAITRDGGPIDADVAILDGGIAPHKALTVVGGRSHVGRDPRANADRAGHGTTSPAPSARGTTRSRSSASRPGSGSGRRRR